MRACDIEALKTPLLIEFGSDVNITNVPPDTVLDLETPRIGLGVAAGRRGRARLGRLARPDRDGADSGPAAHVACPAALLRRFT